jgi:integrase
MDGLRHTWISALLAVGVHKDYVAKMAGNSVGDIDGHYEKALQLQEAARWLGMHYST